MRLPHLLGLNKGGVWRLRRRRRFPDVRDNGLDPKAVRNLTRNMLGKFSGNWANVSSSIPARGSATFPRAADHCAGGREDQNEEAR
jgi:hypothetical protein